MTDRELLREAAQGNGDAFERLYLKHRGRMLSVAARICDGDAEDALAEAMLRVFMKASQYRGDAEVSTWMHRIVVNTAMDVQRRSKLRFAEMPPGYEPDPDEGPSGILSRREIMRQAYGRLTLEQKRAVLLVDAYGFTTREAAEIVGVPEGTLKSRVIKARAVLSEQLGHMMGWG